MTSIDAFWPVLVANLGLTPRDLAEIGGFSERFARDLLSGRKPFPEDVHAALEDIQDDIDVMTDSLVADIEEGVRVIHVYRTNDEMRRLFPEWPGRGRATGGFVGPHRIAALGAWEHARDAEIPAVLRFIPLRSGQVAAPPDSVQ